MVIRKPRAKTATTWTPEGSGRPGGDIYTLGMVLYEAVTGQGRREDPKTPTDLEREPGVPESMKIFYQACEHDPLAHYQTATEMPRASLDLKPVQQLVANPKQHSLHPPAQRTMDFHSSKLFIPNNPDR